MDEFIISPKITALDCINKEPIILIYQFFIHDDTSRNKEIRQCLKFNVQNKYIDKIILLNERKYTDDELGIKDKKIRQVNINKRLSYKDVFNYVQGDNLKGYIITCNADIFFDDTLNKIFKTELHFKKQVLTPLRFDYNDNKKMPKYKLFGPCADSCDTWIFHSKFNPTKVERKLTNFNFGFNKCDLKIAYIFNMLGYELINDPFYIKNYHFDKPERKREVTEEVDGPYLYIVPHLDREYGTEYHPASLYLNKIKKTALEYTDNKQIFFNDKQKFNELIKATLNSNIPLTVYRVNKELVNFVSSYLKVKKYNENTDNFLAKLSMATVLRHIEKLSKKYINIKDADFISMLGELNISLISNSDVILHTTPITKEFKENIEECEKMINISKKGNSLILNKSVVSLTNCVDNMLWLESIKNKNILIISDNSRLINEQSEFLNKIWNNKKIFEDCNFYTLKAPVNEDKHGMDAHKYINSFVSLLLSKMGDLFKTIDLVLIGDTIYSCFLTKFFKDNNKSVFDVGQNLELYFGIYNNETLLDYKPVIDLYKNEHWLKI